LKSPIKKGHERRKINRQKDHANLVTGLAWSFNASFILNSLLISQFH